MRLWHIGPLVSAPQVLLFCCLWLVILSSRLVRHPLNLKRSLDYPAISWDPLSLFSAKLAFHGYLRPNTQGYPGSRVHSHAPSIRSHKGTKGQRDISGFSRYPANDSLRRTWFAFISFGKIQFLPPYI